MKKTNRIPALLFALLFILLPLTAANAQPNIPGDVDGDGSVTATDARFVLRSSVGLERLTDRQLAAARVLGSAKPSAADARAVLRMSVDLEDPESRIDEKCREVIAGMTTEQKIAQMIMPQFRTFNGENVWTLPDEIAQLMSRYGFAGVILYAQNTVTAQQTLRLTDSMQRANARQGRPGLLIATDQEGGTITRLATGTQMPGNMALGAAGDASLTRQAAGVIGSELKSVGINVDLAPVVDVIGGAANSILGVRAFSDDPALTARLGSAYVCGLQDADVTAALKHFPGHGDTGTDSHTGLPRIDKSYEALKKKELVPFAAAIDAGAEMVMTAHIQFPQIEKSTYRSVKTGQNIPLPATLSETMITDVLRGDLGFQGVVITDAMNMDAVAAHFRPLDAAALAINAGVDILLVPVDTSYSSGLRELERYIAELAAAADGGSVQMDKVNAAVSRILKLKYRKGLIEPYRETELETLAAAATAAVGSRAHHETEWEITKKTVAMVKNSGDALPVTKRNQSIVLLAAYEDELPALRYAIGRLQEEGKLPPGSSVRYLCYADVTASQLGSRIGAADYVFAVSELYRAAALNPYVTVGGMYAKLDAALSHTHAVGGKFIQLSCHLPYDAARLTGADAVLICWSDRGMSEDPRNAENGVSTYGPNIPAAVYLAFDASGGPTGRLPVNIPKLTADFDYSDTLLYRRGFGLSY